MDGSIRLGKGVSSCSRLLNFAYFIASIHERIRGHQKNMFSQYDHKYLQRLISRNDVVLFLGSGFSRGVTNRGGYQFPTGNVLSQKIWEFLNLPGEFDGTSLPDLFQAFLINAKRKKAEKIDFLEYNLLCDLVPKQYETIAIPYWYKIYSLNIDNVLDKAFNQAKRPFHTLIHPRDEFKERDQSLEETQIVYLHGKLPCDPEELVFSTKQYARSQLTQQPLYAQFVYDYSVKPTIFLGTDLNEPIFERYIEAREGKAGYGELRPKSFLITPSLSVVRKENFLKQYNVHHIEGTTEQFLEWLASLVPELPSRREILKTTFPSLADVMSFSAISDIPPKSLKEFSRGFTRVPRDFKVDQNGRSAFLRGASPTWNDIFLELDIPRTVTDSIYFSIDEELDEKRSDKLKVRAVVGSAGSGKSTVLRRMALQLAQNGRTVFSSYCDYIPQPNHISSVLDGFNERVVLCFDNAKNVISKLRYLLESFVTLKNPPVVVLFIRTNHWDRLNHVLNPENFDVERFEIPNLDDREITDLIEKLESNNLLGTLGGMTHQQRVREFKNRAKKQILVAMKEATHGRSFNEIIRDEFNGIEPLEAQLLCLCVALNTELGFTNSKQDFVGFASVSHAEALALLDSALSGTILWVGAKDRFMIRHRVLADFMIDNCASKEMLKEAYIRVLSVLAPELKYSPASSRKFTLYKALVNHRTLYRRFEKDINKARRVYESISDYFREDYNYWLQYGSLEVEGDGGDLELAENYLLQADSLKPNFEFTQSAICNLYYKQSFERDGYSEALILKNKAADLGESILRKGLNKDNPHIYHIICKGEYNFIHKWIDDPGDRKKHLKELKNRAVKAFKLHPRNIQLEAIMEEISRRYLLLGVDDDSADEPL